MHFDYGAMIPDCMCAGIFWPNRNMRKYIINCEF